MRSAGMRGSSPVSRLLRLDDARRASTRGLSRMRRAKWGRLTRNSVGGRPPGGQAGAQARAAAGPGPGPPHGPQRGAQPGPAQGDIRRLLGLRPAAARQPAPGGGAAAPVNGPEAPQQRSGEPHQVAPNVGQPRAHAPRTPGRAQRAGASAPPDPAQRDLRALFRQPEAALAAGPARGVGGGPGGAQPGGVPPVGMGAVSREAPAHGSQGATPPGGRAASAPPRAGGLARGSSAGSRGPEVGGVFPQPPPAPSGGFVPAQAHAGPGPAHSVAGPGRASVLDLLRVVTPLEPD